MNDKAPRIGCVILAGGLARRMDGRDKGLINLAGKPMAQWVLESVTPQVDTILINANRNLDVYAKMGSQVAPDLVSGHLGPLAGLLTAFDKLAEPLVFMCPCDSPFVPEDMVKRLYASLETGGADIAVAHDGDRMQPVFCLARRTLADSLAQFLDSGERKIDRWYAQEHAVTADFSDAQDAFNNINSEAERLAVEQQLST